MSEQTHSKISCYICGKRFNSISGSHVQSHGLSLAEYETLYGSQDQPYNQCSYAFENLSPLEDLTQYRCKLHAPDGSFCILHDQDEKKDQALFSRVFQGLLKLYKASDFEYRLQGILFPAEVNLNYLTFKKPVYLIGCRFQGNVAMNVTFQDAVDFRKCLFNQSAHFRFTKFLAAAYFNHATFSDRADFQEAIFANTADFSNVTFEGMANFHLTRFAGRAAFLNSIFPQHPKKAVFVAARFDRPNLVHFGGVDLTRTFFQWVNLTNVGFVNVHWPVTSRFKGGRRYMADESNVSKPTMVGSNHSTSQKYGFVQALYKQLRMNYEARRNYSVAGDFYFGEMECYRKRNPYRRFLPSATNLYRLLSGYGQRHLRASVALILLLATFAVLHLTFGLNPQANMDHITTKLQGAEIKSLGPGVLAATVYCAEVLLREPEPERLFYPASVSGEVLNVIFPILIYVQATLLVLALRNRFRR
ncbi:MAG: pentapeptide repeat-containing protein [bacterium]